jgi:hypothetical protein
MRANRGLGTQGFQHANVPSGEAVNDNAPCNIEDMFVPRWCKTKGSKLESGVSEQVTGGVVQGFRWLGYVAVNMGAAALAYADHPSVLELRVLFSNGLRASGVQDRLNVHS